MGNIFLCNFYYVLNSNLLYTDGGNFSFLWSYCGKIMCNIEQTNIHIPKLNTCGKFPKEYVQCYISFQSVCICGMLVLMVSRQYMKKNVKIFFMFSQVSLVITYFATQCALVRLWTCKLTEAFPQIETSCFHWIFLWVLDMCMFRLFLVVNVSWQYLQE